jgi:hypothetical protein
MKAPTGNESRPTSTANLTLHQVAVTIVSCNGINKVLDAMRAYPNNIDIQENGCKVLGNILAILYCRKTRNVLSFERYLGEATIQLSKSIVRQIVHAMRNHPSNVAVHCAAIPALHHYFLSVLVTRTNDATMLECQTIVLQKAQEMFLPTSVQNMLQATTCLAEQFAINFC